MYVFKSDLSVRNSFFIIYENSYHVLENALSESLLFLPFVGDFS